MNCLIPFELTQEKVAELKQWLNAQESIFAFADDEYCSLLICYVLTRELGGPNDDLARHL